MESLRLAANSFKLFSLLHKSSLSIVKYNCNVFRLRRCRLETNFIEAAVMISIFIFGYIIWILSEIILNRLMRSKAFDKQNTDKSSLSLIWITIIISIALSVYISTKYYIPIFNKNIVRYIGLFMILAGVVLRLIIIKSLGQFFTVDVTIRQNHVLKKDGFYSYLRHPSYFASLISFVGFGLSLNNLISLLIITFSVLIVFIYRIKVEEKALIEHFDGEYLEYKKSTKGLIPFIY